MSGASGIIGSRLCKHLSRNGFKIKRLGRNANGDPSVITCDLMNEKPIIKHPDFFHGVSTVIHLAANAHGLFSKKCKGGKNCNTNMLENMLFGLEHAHWVFASSVRVYDMFHSEGFISPESKVGAVDEYGQGKVDCERILLSKVKSVDIVRLPPVFDQSNLNDVKKRVLLPGGVIKVEVYPPPRHSFCHTDTICKYIEEVLRIGPNGRWIHHCVDTQNYSQSDLLKMFPGLQIRVGRHGFERMIKMFKLDQGGRGRIVCRIFDRLFINNLYAPGKVKIA